MTTGPEHRYATDFHDRFVDKYQRGRAEHGTHLTSRDCLKEAEDEVLDLWAYVQGMKDQREEVLRLLDDVLERSRRGISETLVEDRMEEAINILKYGNKEGRPEGLPITEGDS